MEKETEQLIFDVSASHLMEQGYRSRDCEGECVYAGADGSACALGVLMSRASAEAADRSDAVITASFDRWILPEYRGTNRKLLRALQELHDLQGPSRWLEGLLNVAKRAKLDPGILISYGEES